MIVGIPGRSGPGPPSACHGLIFLTLELINGSASD